MAMHEGGCSCGKVRYATTSDVRRAVVCRCRYCQTRTGSAFGISVYFDKAECRFMRVNSPIIHMRLRVVVQVPHASVQTVEQRCFGT